MIIAAIAAGTLTLFGSLRNTETFQASGQSVALQSED
jgi:hypothetical protein